jgi:hypothetical protein
LKFKIECNSPLLQHTLEYLLKDYLDENGIIITDDLTKDGIIIGKDIKKPFTKISLLLQLEKLLKKEKNSFEQKLNLLMDEFKEKLIQLIKEKL